MINLKVSWLKHFGGASVVVHNCDRQNFKSHLISQVLSYFVILDGFFKLTDGIVIFVSELPPLGTELRNVADFVHFKVIYQLLELFINFGQIFQIESN